jgi:hypothetical protein
VIVTFIIVAVLIAAAGSSVGIVFGVIKSSSSSGTGTGTGNNNNQNSCMQSCFGGIIKFIKKRFFGFSYYSSIRITHK